MRNLILFLLAVILVVCSQARADEPQEFALGTISSCPSPPCAFPNSYKVTKATAANPATIVVEIQGTATVDVLCKPCNSCSYHTIYSETSSSIKSLPYPCVDLKAEVSAMTAGTASVWLVRRR